MFPGLDGRVALVTGANRGIGRATAAALSDGGATVVGLDAETTPPDGEPSFAETVESGTLLAGDVRDPDDVAAAVARAREHGDLSVVVNNAGVGSRGSIAEATAADLRDLLAVHVEGAYRVCRETVPAMADRGAGAVVNVSSIAALGGYPEAAAYGPAKGAVASLTRQLAADFSPAGVRVNAVAPGFIRTAMNEAEWRHPDFPENSAEMDRTLLPDPGDPEDVAGAVAFLASDAARFVTGQVLPVDGGWTL